MEVNEVMKIIDMYMYDFPPHVKVAYQLYFNGMTEKKFHDMRNELNILDDWYISISNSLRDIEKQGLSKKL